MRSWIANEDSRLSYWRFVREFAVPPAMIESATARRTVGDWAGACAATRVDVDLNLRSVTRVHGRELAAQVRADLRQLAPDLLRWHLPRIAPDGLLRPGVTISLARYQVGEDASDGSPVHLVARTPPAWANAGQRFSLALWNGSRSRVEAGPHPHPYPHPRPDRRFRFDLHRHLWDARRTGELRSRSGANRVPEYGRTAAELDVLRAHGCAVDRWAAEAQILLGAEGRAGGPVAVRLGSRHRLVLELGTDGEAGDDRALRITPAAAAGRVSALPVLPDAATWVPPDLALLRAGLIDVDQLHPLVASALVPGRPPADTREIPDTSGAVPRLVECRGTQHRIGLRNGVLVPWDHDPAEIRREELLAALTGTPLPCLQAIDEAHRHPECLVDVRARLDHGDTAGALAAVENLLGPGALLRSGALRDELETAALRRIAYGLFRAGIGPRPTNQPGPHPTNRSGQRPTNQSGQHPTNRSGQRPRDYRPHPRHAISR